VSDCCYLFSQTFYGFIFSYLTIIDVTSYVHHKFPVSLLLYIATKNTCQINHIITVNSSMNAPTSETFSSQKNNSCTPCVPMFFSILLLRSLFRLKELFKVKNGLTASLHFPFFLKMSKIWVGRTTLNGEKNRGWPYPRLHLCNFC